MTTTRTSPFVSTDPELDATVQKNINEIVQTISTWEKSYQNLSGDERKRARKLAAKHIEALNESLGFWKSQRPTTAFSEPLACQHLTEILKDIEAAAQAYQTKFMEETAKNPLNSLSWNLEKFISTQTTVEFIEEFNHYLLRLIKGSEDQNPLSAVSLDTYNQAYQKTLSWATREARSNVLPRSTSISSNFVNQIRAAALLNCTETFENIGEFASRLFWFTEEAKKLPAA